MRREKPLGQLVADLQREFGGIIMADATCTFPMRMKNGSIRRAAIRRPRKLGA